MSNEPKRVKWILEACIDVVDECTEWEQGFLRNVEEAFRKRGEISDARYATLEKIYEQRCQ